MTLKDLLQTHGREISHGAGYHLFRQGDQDKSLHLIASGLLKAYYLSVDGKEHIKSFLLPGDMIGSLQGIMGDSGCSFSLMCLEPSELITLPFDKLRDLTGQDIALANEVVNFLLAFGMKKEVREFELLCLSPEDRYLRLLERSPQLFDHVTQNEIARYLGVTPVGLSRIKKRVRETG